MPPLPPGTPLNAQKYGFDTDFFEIAVAPNTPSLSAGAPPVAAAKGNSAQAGSTAEKIAAARDEGFAAGLAEGRAQAAQAAAVEVAELKNALLTLTQKLSQAQHEWTAQQVNQNLSILRVALHHLIGHAATHFPDQLFEHFLHDLVPLLPVGEELHLRLHPQARTYHEKLGLPQASIGGRPFHVVPDPSLGPADVIIEWRSGGLEARLPDILARLDTLLLGAGAQNLPVPDAPTANGFTPPLPASVSAEAILKAAAPPATTATHPNDDPLAHLSAATQARQDALLSDE